MDVFVLVDVSLISFLPAYTIVRLPTRHLYFFWAPSEYYPKILKIRALEKFTVIILKFEHGGITVE